MMSPRCSTISRPPMNENLAAVRLGRDVLRDLHEPGKRLVVERHISGVHARTNPTPIRGVSGLERGEGPMVVDDEPDSASGADEARHQAILQRKRRGRLLSARIVRMIR